MNPDIPRGVMRGSGPSDHPIQIPRYSRSRTDAGAALAAASSILRIPILLSVLFYQSFFLAAGQLWANKVRAILTTIGIVIGVSSVAAVIAALTGLKTSVLAEFETFGTNKLFVFPYMPDSGRAKNWSRQKIMFLPEEFDGMLDHCPSVRTFTRMTNFSRALSAGGRSEVIARVIGIENTWHEIENRQVILGRPFSLVDNEQLRPVCLINEKVRDRLTLDRDPTGSFIFLGDRRFRVVGLLNSRAESSMFGQMDAELEVFIPYTTSRQMQERGGFTFVIASAKRPELSEEARAEINFFLRRQRAIEPGQESTFKVEAVEEFVQQFKKVANAITVVAGGVVGISLLVGGVGIMNIMLVSVSERTREIGLRKAVGARPSAILLQFLIEAVVLCLAGGLLGLAVGQFLVSVMTRIPQAQLTKAYIPLWAIVLALGFSAGVGVVFGMFPAVKAARLDPIEALRHE